MGGEGNKSDDDDKPEALPLRDETRSVKGKEDLIKRDRGDGDSRDED